MSQLYFYEFYYLERYFEHLLSSYLQFSPKDEQTFVIEIEEIGEIPSFNFEIYCKIEDRKDVFRLGYSIKYENATIKFLELIYALQTKYSVIIQTTDSKVIFKIIKSIFANIKSNIPFLKRRIEDYNLKNNDKFKKYEDDVFQQIEFYLRDIFFTTEESFNIYLTPPNRAIIPILRDQFKEKQEVNVFLDIEALYKVNKNYAYLFELYYKQVICDNFSLYTSANEYGLLGFSPYKFKVEDRFRNINFFDSVLDHRYNVSMGQYFPFIFIRTPELAQELYDYSLNSDKEHTPFGLYKFNNFSLNKSDSISKLEAQKILRKVSPVSYAKAVKYWDDYKQTQAYKDFEFILGTLPKIYFLGDTFGLIILELAGEENKPRILARFCIFNTTSKESGSMIFYSSFSIDMQDPSEIDLMKRSLAQAKEIFDYYFHFYPFHPFFFTRSNIYAILYSAIIDGHPNLIPDLIEEYDLQLKKGGHTYPYSITFFNIPNYPDLIKNYDEYNLYEEALFSAIETAFLNHKYLWIMIYIEKALQWSIDDANYTEGHYIPNIKYFKEEFVPKVEERITDLLNKNVNSKRYYIKIYIDTIENCNINKTYLSLSYGLYILTFFDTEKKEGKIIKLNSVSFNDAERRLIPELFQVWQERGNLNPIIETYEDNFMEGILIKEILSIEKFTAFCDYLFKDHYKEFALLNYLPHLREHYNKHYQEKALPYKFG